MLRQFAVRFGAEEDAEALPAADLEVGDVDGLRVGAVGLDER